MFVTIEGIEGAGKSTQQQRLAEALRRAGRAVVETREPGGRGRLAASLRSLLKDPDIWRGLRLAEVWLYAAARAHHVETVIAPALETGAVVVCDRFADSTRAYQGYGRGRPLDLIEALHALEPLRLVPHRTVLLDVDPAVGLARARARGTADAAGYDDASRAFFERVRRGFLEIAAREPDRVRVVDGARDEAAVHRDVVAALGDLVSGLAPVEAPDR
ncbi:MAG: dTMP kinase [Acidobacteria bacterium]|nr:MAG: dTMP kinase [Acidobacteriota bacterium]